MTNNLFWKFTITEPMREWAEEHKEQIEAKYLDDMRSIWIEFCNKFNTEGDFDMWGNPDWDQCLMYVASIGIWPSVIIDWDIWRDTVEEFLSFIEESENYINFLKENVKRIDK